MSSNARIFFAGVGTTFVILAVGLRSGLMMASSTLPDTTGRAGSTSVRLAPVRAILPASAEPAQPRAAPTRTTDDHCYFGSGIAAASPAGKRSPGYPQKSRWKSRITRRARSRAAGTPSSIC